MDKNKFWLGGRLFNTASPRLGTQTQQGTSARWAPKCITRHVRKLGAPTHIYNANTRHVHTSASWVPQRNARHVRKMGAQTQHKACPQVGRPNATQGMCTSWVPQRRSAMQTQGTSARPQDGCPNATQGMSARWSPKRKIHPQRKHPHKGALG